MEEEVSYCAIWWVFKDIEASKGCLSFCETILHMLAMAGEASGTGQDGEGSCFFGIPILHSCSHSCIDFTCVTLSMHHGATC